jgi:hypothetical protein
MIRIKLPEKKKKEKMERVNSARVQDGEYLVFRQRETLLFLSFCFFLHYNIFSF